MNLVKNSFFFGLIFKVWFMLTDSWRESNAARICFKIGEAIKKLWNNSFSGKIITRNSEIDRLWADSAICNIIQKICNVVPSVLHWLYTRCRNLWEGSFIFRAITFCGENAYIFLSWIILMILVIPQDYWNNAYSFLAVAFILALIYAASMRKVSYRLELGSIGFFPVVYAAMAIIAYLTSSYPTASFRFLLFHITCMLAVLVCVNAIRNLQQLKRVLGFAVFGLFIASLFGIYQRIVGIEVDNLLVDITVNTDTPGRIFSFFENPNSFAMIIVMLLPVCISLTIITKGKLRWFYGLVLVLGLVALLMTYSRGAWMSFAFSIGVLFLVLWPKCIPLLIAFVVIAFPFLPDRIINRLLSTFNFKDTSISSRLPLYKSTWSLFTQNPVLGVGLGSDVVKIRITEAGVYKLKMVYVHAHNIYLQIAAEMGAVGLIAFIGSMVSSIKSGVKVITGRKGSRDVQLIVGSLIAGLSGVLLNGMVDYPWSYPRVMVIFWIIVAFLLSGIKVADQNDIKMQIE